MITEITKTEKVAGNGINMKAQIPCRQDITKEGKIGFAMDVSNERDKGTRKVNVLLQNQRTGLSKFIEILFIYTYSSTFTSKVIDTVSSLPRIN